MIKRTILFGNPGYLHVRDSQLVWKPDDAMSQMVTIPIEDLGVVIIDHYGITVTQSVLTLLVDNNCAVVVCDSKHHPSGIMIANNSHSQYSQVVQAQLEASLPLKKNLWQQVIKAKIKQQAEVLKMLEEDYVTLTRLCGKVNSGDTLNCEGQAAAYYFGKLFGQELKFRRGRYLAPPNNLLNYGYAILRAITARSLTGSGLLGVVGLHHKNKYNPWCLADDIMEPYRPFVDKLVLQLCSEITVDELPEELTPEWKRKLLTVPVLDVDIEDEKRPLSLAVQRTTASLARAFLGETRKLILP